MKGKVRCSDEKGQRLKKNGLLTLELVGRASVSNDRPGTGEGDGKNDEEAHFD